MRFLGADRRVSSVAGPEWQGEGSEMITGAEYRQRIMRLRDNLYMGGGKIRRDDPRLTPGVNIIAETFDLVRDPELGPLLTATSHLSGQPVNRFCHIHQSGEDLLAKQKMTRLLCHRTGGCIQRCLVINLPWPMPKSAWTARPRQGRAVDFPHAVG